MSSIIIQTCRLSIKSHRYLANVVNIHQMYLANAIDIYQSRQYLAIVVSI